MANPFTQPYASQDLVARTRARNLFWILGSFIVAMSALGLITALDSGAQTAAVAFSVALLFAVSLEFLRRGRYLTAANLAFAVLVVASVAGSLINRVGDSENDFFRLTAVFSMSVVLVTFFGHHWLMGVAMAVAGLATMVVVVVTPYPDDQMQRTLAEIHKTGTPGAVVVIFVMTAAVATLGLFQTGRILQSNRESQKITEEGFADLQAVFAESQAGLEVSRQMEGTSRDLQTGARSIQGELTVLEDQTAGLLVQAKDAGASSSVLESVQRDLTEKMEVQVRSIHQTSSALEQINALFQQIATSSRAKKESLDELGARAREGERRIADMAKAFAAMQKTAQDVLSVVQVIDDISSRTNLLAMNASIEAAHAGNSGRGFAVVAAEIRKLAEETSRNSQAIRQTLDGNLTQVQRAVHASEESQKLLQTMVGAFQDIQHLLGEQMNGMDEMGQGTRDILQSVEELQTGTGIVQTAAVALEGAVKANQTQAANLGQAAQALTEGVVTLRSVAGVIGGTASALEDYGQKNHQQVQGLRQRLEKVSADMRQRKDGLK